MRKLVVLSVMVLVLGCASWAGAWTYSTSTWNNSAGPVVSAATVEMEFYFGQTLASTFSYGETDALGSDVVSSDGNPVSRSVNNQVFLGLTPSGGSLMTSGTLVALTGHSDYAYLVFFGNNFDYWNGTGGDFGAWSGEFDKVPEAGMPKTGISVCVVGIKAAPVPVPAAVWLLGSGLGTLIVVRRRRKA